MVRLKLKCPDCGEVFRVEMEAGQFPDFCLSCGTYVGVDPSFVPSQMNIGSAIGKSVDATYRELEASAAVRAELAGDPSLKMTDMKDGLKMGETSGIVPNNAVTQAAAQMGHQFFQGNVGDALGMAQAGGKTGTGAPVLRAIQGGAGGVSATPTGLIKPSWGGGTA